MYFNSIQIIFYIDDIYINIYDFYFSIAFCTSDCSMFTSFNGQWAISYWSMNG